MIVEVEDKKAGKMKIAGNPIKMSSIEEETTRMPAPEIGEHNKEIYGTLLNLSSEEINTLKKEGVI
jgi:crotonobetainyl-CoA:carnitine CoA-transferase CaiB-like acyl-CoA transferase